MITNEAQTLPRSFWALNVSQCLGAMNDNVFRWVMVFALMARATAPDSEGVDEAPLFISGLIFATPFILFSSACGILADRFSKRRLIVLINVAGIVVMSLGFFAFISDWPLLLYAVLFLMVTQSTLMGPCKLGILPEMVPPSRLSAANGLMSMMTYIGIILGTVGAAGLFHLMGAPEGAVHPSTTPLWKASLVCIVLATGGLLSSLLIEDTGPRASGKRATPLPWSAVGRNLRLAGKNAYLRLALFAIAFFWFLSAYIQQNVTAYGVDILGLSKPLALTLFLSLAFGVAIGAVLAGKASGRSVEIGLVPFGALVVSVSLMLLLIGPKSIYTTLTLLVAAGIGGGFYIVPLNAFVQSEAPEKDRGEIIATMAFLSFCGVALSSAILHGLDAWLHIDPAGRFFLLGLATFALAGVVVWILPDFLIRFVGMLLTRVLFNLRIKGIENLPTRGGALLTPNHVSYLDAVLLIALQPRRIRFMMERSFYDWRAIAWFCRVMGAIPVSATYRPKEMVEAFRQTRRCLDDGYLVCLFPEGMITRSGYVNEFKRGFERVVKDSDHPVIPVSIHGIFGSIFTFSNDSRLRRFWRFLQRNPVTITFGEPLPSNVSAYQTRQAVMALDADAACDEFSEVDPLPLEFARVARKHWTRPCLSDTTGQNLSFGRTLAGSLALAKAFRPLTRGQRNVGVLMPTSAGGALVNIALGLLGKTTVNLNYTSSDETVRSAIAQCDIKTVISARRFIDRVGFEDLPGLTFIEDIGEAISKAAKVRALLKARFCPSAFLMTRDRSIDDGRHGGRRYGGDPSETATIMFSSGSTGEPKGVEITHASVVSNCRAVRQCFRLTKEDTFCGVLPFFHAFGYTATIWLPLLSGIDVAFHTNPTEAGHVGRLISRAQCSILIGTPTFLSLYARKIKHEQLASLRIVVTGAEKLRDRVARQFEEASGVAVLEGYGATELSPVASLNAIDVRVKGVHERCDRPGTIGRPIPGIAMKVVDLDDQDHELGPDEDGLLLVSGPNVMKGYLGRSEATAEVIRNGWYVTGDIARIGHDGFVTITDRLSRFSKIGGEMIPHVAIEDAINDCLDLETRACAVTAIPDERKGEQLVALLTEEAGDVGELLKQLKASGLPNLWIPSRKNFRRVDEIPILGAGKVDLRALRTLAGDCRKA